LHFGAGDHRFNTSFSHFGAVAHFVMIGQKFAQFLNEKANLNDNDSHSRRTFLQCARVKNNPQCAAFKNRRGQMRKISSGKTWHRSQCVPRAPFYKTESSIK